MNIYWITRLRAVACIAIVLLHAAILYAWNGNQNTNNLYWDFGSLVDTVSRAFIPVFFIISGYLYSFGNGNSSRRKGIYLLITAILISLAYIYWNGVSHGLYTKIMSYNKSNNGTMAVIELFMGISYYHVWFLFVIGLNYIFLSKIKRLIKYCNTSNVIMFYVIVFGLLVALTSEKSCIADLLNIPTIGFLLYAPMLMIGMNEFKDQAFINTNHRKTLVVSMSMLLALNYLVGYLDATYGASYDVINIDLRTWNELIHSYFNPLYIIAGISLVSIFSHNNQPTGRVIQKISDHSLMIYLVHPAFIDAISCL